MCFRLIQHRKGMVASILLLCESFGLRPNLCKVMLEYKQFQKILKDQMSNETIRKIEREEIWNI